MKQSKRAIAALAIAASLAGGAAGLTIAGPSLAGAAEAAQGAAQGTVSWVGQALGNLVSDGTITQTQADAVQKALDSARPAGGHGGPGGAEMGRGGMGMSSVATALGMTEDELRTATASGQTLAQIAGQKGVEVQKLVDAIVGGMRDHLAEEVASGEHTQAEADQMLADAAQRATAMVNGQMPTGPGGPGGHGHGDRGPGAEQGTRQNGQGSSIAPAPSGAPAMGHSRAS